MTRADAYFDSGLGYSDFKLLLESPAKYAHATNVGRTETPAMALGSLTHALVLGQPVEYVVKDWDGRTNEGKARAAEVAERGLRPISADDWAAAERMADKVLSHPVAGQLFTEGSPEVAAHREVDGVKVRAKADWLRNDGLIVDLKTTVNASPRAFERACANFMYHLQAPNYIDTFEAAGTPVRGFVLVAVEKDEPHVVSVHEFDDLALARGRELIAEALAIYRECVAVDEWPDFRNQTINTVSLPSWAA